MNPPFRPARQLALFDLAEPSPSRDEAPSRVVAPEPVEADGQLGLLESRTAFLVPLAQELAAARWADAVARALGRGGEEALAAVVASVKAAVEGAGVEVLAPETFAAAREEAQRLGGIGVARAIEVGRCAEIAHRLDDTGPSTTAAGRRAGEWWLAAGRVKDAITSLTLACEDAPGDGGARLWLGNAWYASGDVARARETWRQAFRIGPDAVDARLVADPEIASLAEEAESLGLTPGGAWVPFLGRIRGLMHGSPETFDGRGHPTDVFNAALIRAQLARRAGRPDVEARRILKRLAPELFADILEGGLA